MAVIAGNWKMHMGAAQTRAFFAELDLDESASKNELLIFPPVSSLGVAAACPDRDSRIQLGVQNIHWQDEGAFTGETSAPMAAEAGASHVLIGHSERRHVFGETNEEVALKIAACCSHGLVPVVCVGETLAQRQEGRVDEVILGQLDAALQALEGNDGRFLLAYEPVWAIGTGKTATSAQAQEVHAFIRNLVGDIFDEDTARRSRIQYGGSVKPDNARELMSQTDVDGALVGGASLDVRNFSEIILNSI